jgi:acyl-CoA thioesterase-2
MNPIESLLRTLDLTDTGARTEEDIFTGPSQRTAHGRVYGGQVLAQALTASVRTVAADRAVHSMHAYFLRPGDSQLPITFAVDRIHDGRSFSARRTQAYQNGVPILSAIASFQDDDAGLEHHSPMPSGIPEPEDLPSAADLLADVDHPIGQTWARERPFDIRHIPSPIYLSVEGEHTDRQAVWMRATSPLPDSPHLHQAALAYASDYTILEPVLRRHGVPWATPGSKIASLDHAMWWHRPARVDDWLLYVQDSPSASGGRGLSRGLFYSRSGQLVASVAQEGMLRMPARD